VNHDAQHQLDWLGHALSQEVFTRQHSSRQGMVSPAPVRADDSPQDDAGGEHRSPSHIEIRADPARESRKGVPEVIFAETKTATQIIATAHSLLAGNGRAIISRVRPELLATIRQEFEACTLKVCEAARALVIYQPGYTPARTGGHVGILTAGTSDIPAAEEAALVAAEMGCLVSRVYDVGVAGLHRLLPPLRELLGSQVDVLIVAAGMDGALPSVVAGLVPVPVIGLPTSVGYGLGGNGVAALLSMLQTCAPGLAVVNIDNGVGAGSTAALIANHAARRAAEQAP
jgi:hypothetical protein